ncbi:hypothetical protein [Mycobacterium intracellulare]|uniref:Uncharacterized protein n=1 Tax=Mycobacterium intracellulare TaxID=1767 RepID=A0AAE4U228_MYCIT|nr:hypothetical protein [Mycobacterium intracellulare]MDV6975292.1 hypothetical protein [Mycobacterium intracellulare]MDV6980356.1 hypothetical protein [Mycobacterium intracellulare]MDV7010785.1 hypothetical protein [Mycobacterium intracellulare]MDV7025691.1 hypothetical protein [Mycobacterium intracellulare]
MRDIPEGVIVSDDLTATIPSFFIWLKGIRYMDLGRGEDGSIIWDEGEVGATVEDNAWLEAYAPFVEVWA